MHTNYVNQHLGRHCAHWFFCDVSCFNKLEHKFETQLDPISYVMILIMLARGIPKKLYDYDTKGLRL